LIARMNHHAHRHVDLRVGALDRIRRRSRVRKVRTRSHVVLQKTTARR
jgi:hypothetical protein